MFTITTDNKGNKITHDIHPPISATPYSESPKSLSHGKKSEINAIIQEENIALFLLSQLFHKILKIELLPFSI